MTSFWSPKTNWSKPKKKKLKGEFIVWRIKGPRSVISLIFAIFHFIFDVCCWNFVKMENILRIEHNVDSTTTPPILTNSRVDMANFVDLHKVVFRSACLVLPSAWNGGELEGGAKSGRLKHQFSQVKGDT
jgi:hypothetical protein